MDGGPNTNTRTIDDAIGEAIEQLTEAPQTAQVAHLLGEVRRYRRIIASWEQEPPAQDVQFEVIGELMSLLGKAMSVGQDPDELELRHVDAPSVKLGPDGPVSEPAPQPRARRRKLPSLELELPRARPITPPGPRPWLDEVVRMDDALEPLGGEDGRCPEGELRPVQLHRIPWRPSTTCEGVDVRSITDEGASRRHLMVRLAPGAELAEHVHGTSEVILVWDGCIELGGDLLHAGGCVVAALGDASPVLRAVGEATLVLFDTDRRLEDG
ncbi:MAG TPA: hypothetical protein ENK57_00790 [Polyangiaceae bacterium]|nr:hypothetical protein [Polyangiaceae bacterium]